MKIKTFIFSGYIKFHYHNDYHTLSLVDGEKEIDLVKKFRAIFDLYESEVSVSYLISDEKEDEITQQENWIKQLVGGIHAEYRVTSYYYSSWTNGKDYDSFLKIGGHNLFHELNDFSGKWCKLKINVKINETKKI